MVDYQQAVKKPFTDFTKLIIGIILSIVPIINWIAHGFIIECSGTGKSKPSKNMPEWKDVGYYFVKGFLAYLALFIYLIPAIIVFILAAGVAFGSLMNTYLGVMPEGLMSSMMAGQVPQEGLGSLISQNWVLAIPTLLTVAPIILVGLVLLLIAVYLSPIGIMNYLKTKKFSKAFDFNFVFSKALKSDYFIAWIIAGVVTIVLKSILGVVPVIGPAIAYFISGVIAWSLFGEVFRGK